MSALIPSGNATGTGTMTLLAPPTNGTQIVTIPDATGIMMVSGNMPAFSAYQSAQQTLSANTYTKIQFQSKAFDTANCFDNSTNYRFTPNVAGYYQLSASVTVSASACGIILQIYKNGSNFMRGLQLNSTTVGSSAAGGLVYANGSTDYFEIYAFFTTGQVTGGDQTGCFFTGAMIRAA